MADTNQSKKAKRPRSAKDSAYVTRTESFSAKVVEDASEGGKRLLIKSPTWYRHQVNKFKAGEEVTLEVHSRRPKRTEAQNRYYWGVYLPLIAAETGESDIDALHALFKGKFLAEGIVEVLGQKVRKTRSTTELGVADFCQYIIDIETETQVAAPPTENYGLEPLSTRDPSP